MTMGMKELMRLDWIIHISIIDFSIGIVTSLVSDKVKDFFKKDN